MYVADSSMFPSDLPTDQQANVLAAFHAWRQVVPTAKRLVVAPWERFLEDANRLRAGLAKGKYDAYLLMPRGAATRSSTPPCASCSPTGAPRSPSPRSRRCALVAPAAGRADAGDPRLPGPDGDAAPPPRPGHRGGRRLVSRYEGDPRWPLVDSPYRDVFAALERPRGGRRHLRAARHHRARHRGRPVHRRRRTRRPGGGGVRRVRGALHGRRRGRGRRRAGRHVAR